MIKNTKKKKLIPIVFTPDEFYIIPTGVAIASILASKNIDNHYLFYIIISINSKHSNMST